MKYFFSSPHTSSEVFKDFGITRVLMSYALDKKTALKCTHYKEVIIDSGAFSLWNNGKGEINIDEYIAYCLSLPQDWWFVNLDVIPETGSGKEAVNQAAERSFVNYEYMRNRVKNVLPVYHYGEHIDFLKKYMYYTNYIGISPANDTHEQTKRDFLRQSFWVTRDKIKTHGFGYSSFEGLELFPFYSVDSVSYKKVHFHQANKQFWGGGELKCLTYKRVRQFLRWESYITQLWNHRNIHWS